MRSQQQPASAAGAATGAKRRPCEHAGVLHQQRSRDRPVGHRPGQLRHPDHRHDLREPPAPRDGMTGGAVITAVNGQAVGSPNDLTSGPSSLRMARSISSMAAATTHPRPRPRQATARDTAVVIILENSPAGHRRLAWARTMADSGANGAPMPVQACGAGFSLPGRREGSLRSGMSARRDPASERVAVPADMKFSSPHLQEQRV